ncbi:putative polyketide synthase [Nemania sp. FL0916]|nr:putative polyketide synthase [Nemania sp. FL0916]
MRFMRLTAGVLLLLANNFLYHSLSLQFAGDADAIPVAICGMGMRLPGGIRTSDALYEFLLNKRDARGPVPPDRYNVDGFYNAQGKSNSLSVLRGYWLDDVTLSHFDPSLFSMGRSEIEELDPQQRLLLEVVRETFENAAETNWQGKNIGCYVGSFGEDWSNLHAKDLQHRGFRVMTGYMDLWQANRVSYEYDLRGPRSMTLRVGCSASGLGIHLACQSIRLGETSSAIVAGINVITSPETTAFMASGGALSSDASSKTFDSSANGYARAEGINCLYIKRLDEAIRDGNPIRAIIRGTSTNAGGKSSGLTAPNIDAQEALIRAAYRSAGLKDPKVTAMVECHGTGTAVGDAMETAAVARVFGERGIHIGSVKPNLGHSEGASANTSIMKAVLELENRILLPNIKFATPNPNIPWETARLKVPTEPEQWPDGRLERISINSYGIGGSNVHVILDSAASLGLSNTAKRPKGQPDFKLLLLSAGHPDSLKQMQENYHAYASQHPERLDDMAYTLSHRREHLPARGFVITRGDDDKVFSPPFMSQPQIKVTFVFTGQGAQWPQMGKELMETYPEVLLDIRIMDKILRQQSNPPGWTLEEEILKSADTSLMAEAEIAQPVSTALQIALCNLLSRWNILPVATIGHSSGEIAAAYAAGSLSMHNAILLAYFRGAASKAQTRVGAMAAVGLGYDEVARWLKPGVVIACENSPSSVTLSGDADALGSMLAALQEAHPEVFQRRLKVNKAYHSHHMRDVGRMYDSLIAGINLKTETPRVPFYSTVVTQQLHRAEDFRSHYWRQNMESPVWFSQAFSDLLKSEVGKDAIYLEVGPHSALAGPIKQIFRAENASNPYLSVLTRKSNGVIDFLSCVGELFSRGVSVAYPLPPTKPRALHDLPLYPWHHSEHWWSESRSMKAFRFQKFPHHDLLGVRTIESSDLEPTWRNVLRLDEVPWLRDHCIGPDIVFPAAGYIAMAGHAAWQVTGLEGYTVREVSFKAAMVLDETLPTEIITRLQPYQLTNNLSSNFFSFSIQSHNGSAWTQHASGLVAGSHAGSSSKLTVTSYSRLISSKRWYRAMSRVGLRYGPYFTGLNEITASVTHDAVSTVFQDKNDLESPYPLHPTAIDFVLQSAIVASQRGQPRLLKQPCLPTFIEEMYIGAGTPGQNIHVNTSAQQRNFRSHGIANGTLVFSLKGLELSSLGREEDQQDEQFETAQLVWKPHLDFLDPETLIRPAQKDEISWANPMIERIFILCIIDVIEEITSINTSHEYLNTYRDWISRQVARIRENGHPLVADTRDLFLLSTNERKELIQRLVANHTEGTMIAGSRILYRCYSHMSDIFKGTVNPLDLMRQEGLLSQYYDCLQDKHEYKKFLQLLGHLQPRMNILEIGAGTGGLTAKLLDILQSESGDALYNEYAFTDISPGFFVDAKERFHNHPRIRYDVLDISKDPIEQGFPAKHYDLIIASNILHATPFLTETLRNTKTLLKADGRLLLQELCPVSDWTNFIFGLFSGWWLGKNDGRADEPYISPKEWDARLCDAGFAGVDASALDADYPYQLNAMIVARPAAPAFCPRRVTLLSIQPSHAVVNLQECLVSDGFGVDLVDWKDDLPLNQDVVALLDLEAPFFDRITSENLAAFLRMVKNQSTAKFLWITHAAQIRPQDPRYAQVLGVARTIRSELGISFATLEAEDFGPGFAKGVCRVLRRMQQQSTEHTEMSEFDHDQEFSWFNGEIHIGRMHWLSVPEALTPRGSSVSRASLEIGRHGLLNTLRWVSRPTAPLQPNEVRIRIISVSMNFKELLVAMGVVPYTIVSEVGGTDSAGIVTAVGSQVTNVSIGDRVMALSVEKTSYTTTLQLPSQFCARIPDDCSFEDAATLPTVYLTVLRSLREKANLRRGQTVLIHSAAGGVGIAAIHYAESVGATIYATVGSPEKTTFLVEKMGVLRKNIFYSRDNTFLPGVMDATGGRGVDVVLNSLSGEQLHASWQCVAQGGNLVEIGKRDLLGRAQLAMNPFLENRSYIGVDIATLPSVEPNWAQQGLETIVHLYKQGVVRPIHPIQTFPAGKVEDAFRHLQRGQHIGKLLIKFDDAESLALAPTLAKLELRADRTYLLVGGMRGIGTSIARWMVEHGAKNLAFLSRTAGEKIEDRLLVRELSNMGCHCQTFPGDVADLAAVQRVVSGVTVPIAGAIQLAMVLADAGVMSMDIKKWNIATKPKVDGTWNLHEALPTDMDFFVMASSLSGIFGHYGQSNYASANTFLDAFAQFRQSRGLAASTVDLGVVDEIGYVSQNASVHRQVVQQMSTAISEESLLNIFHLAILRSRPSQDLSSTCKPLETFRAQNQWIHGILSKAGAAKGQYIWQRDVRTALSRVHLQDPGLNANNSEGAGDGLKALLRVIQDSPETLDDESSVQIVAEGIARQVSIYTMRDEGENVDLSLSLKDCGVDSLVSIELRNWWKREIGIDVTVLQLMSGGSFINLGQKAVDQLKQRYLDV